MEEIPSGSVKVSFCEFVTNHNEQMLLHGAFSLTQLRLYYSCCEWFIEMASRNTIRHIRNTFSKWVEKWFERFRYLLWVYRKPVSISIICFAPSYFFFFKWRLCAQIKTNWWTFKSTFICSCKKKKQREDIDQESTPLPESVSSSWDLKSIKMLILNCLFLCLFKEMK